MGTRAAVDCGTYARRWKPANCFFCLWFVQVLLWCSSAVAPAELSSECWNEGETFEFCCDQGFGPFGNYRCFNNLGPTRNYLKCCGADKAWSKRNRLLRVFPRDQFEARAEVKWLPRFDLMRLAEILEFFIMRLLFAENVRDQQETLLGLKQSCAAGIYVISDLLRLKTYSKRGNVAIGIFSTNGMETHWVPEYAALSCFIVLHSTDDRYMADLRKIRDRGGRFISFGFINTIVTYKFNAMRYLWTNGHALAAASAAHNYSIASGTHFVSNWKRYEGICQMLESTKDLDGDYVEVGVYQGMSARLALEYLSRRQPSVTSQRKWHVHLLDRFSGFTMDEDTWYILTRKEGSMQHLGEPSLNIAWIHDVLQPWNGSYTVYEADIVKDPLPSPLVARGIAAANLDVDSYEATLAALRKVGPLVKLGGIVRMDDTVTTPSLIGSTLAMDDFLEEVVEAGLKFTKFMSDAHYLIRVQ